MEKSDDLTCLKVFELNRIKNYSPGDNLRGKKLSSFNKGEGIN
jgi:hypothetical protein